MILITGASGFVGSAVVRECKAQGLEYICGSRQRNTNSVYINLEDDTYSLPQGITTIIHCAGLASSNNAEELDQINVNATLTLYKEACKKNIKKFIFLSSLHVYGIGVKHYSYTENSNQHPYNLYAQSKSTAEKLLKDASKFTGTPITIVRPPLVYGFNAKGSIGKLEKLSRHCPITPFGCLKNKRSLISVEDLACFLVLCAQREEANGEDFVISEEKPISTRDLYSALAQKRVFHLPIPVSIMELSLKKARKSALAQQLFGDLTADASKARNEMNWEEKNSIYTYYGSLPTNFYFWQRLFDITFSFCGLIALCPILLLLFIAGYFDTGKPLFIQRRLGKNKGIFNLVKFRTMHCGTISAGTHEISSQAVTKWGKFLRKCKLDELPQLWNVLWGDMSLVGPRPGLEVQSELTLEREKHNIFRVRPGITGLAQVHCIDMSTPKLLAKTDYKMIQNYTIKKYFTYIFQTILGQGFGDRVK